MVSISYMRLRHQKGTETLIKTLKLVTNPVEFYPLKPFRKVALELLAKVEMIQVGYSHDYQILIEPA